MVHKQRLKSLQSDPVKFYREFLKVRGESLHEYQKQFLRCGARIIVFLKGRSIGISWASAIKALHRAVMFPNQTVLIVSWNEDQAKQILEYAKMFVRRSHMLQSLVTNRSSLVLAFANGSRIIATGCILPETPLIVKEGDRIFVKPAKAVEIGDEILANGGFSKVKYVFKRWHSGNLYRIKAMHLMPVELTGEHPVLVGVKRERLERRKRRGPVWEIVKREWKPASELKEGDLVVTPKIRLSQGKYFVPNKEEMASVYKRGKKRFLERIKDLKIDEEVGELLGYYLAEGYVNINESKRNYSIEFSFGKNEVELVNRTKELIERKLGYPAYVRRHGQCLCVGFGSKGFAYWLRKEFGRNAREKRVPGFIFFSPKSVIRAFVVGYLRGDGCVRAVERTSKSKGVFWSEAEVRFLKENYETASIREIERELKRSRAAIHGKANNLGLKKKKRFGELKTHLDENCEAKKWKQYSVEFSTTSECLALSMQALLTQLGFHFGLLKAKRPEKFLDGRRIPEEIEYRLYSKDKKALLELAGIAGERKHKAFLEDEEYFYLPVKEIKVEKYDGWVYNFETEDSTYLVKNMLVHNCTRPSASNVRNFHANLLIVDEAALIYDEMFAAITPVVRGMENPQEIYISTAGRIGSFFHRQFVEARKQGVPQGVEGPKGMAWFSVPSSECPRIDLKDLERERERLGKIRFEREYCCVFHGAANQVFPQIPRWNYVLPQKTERPCYIGIDVGLMVNPTVMLVLEEVPKEVDGEEKVVARTCRIFEWRRVSTQQMFREIQMILPNFNVKRMVVDVEGIGEGLFTLLLNANLPVHGMKIKDKQKNDLIFELAEAFERKELWLPEEEDERHRELVFELEGYTAEPSKSKPGIYVFDSVVGREDYVIALALAWHARKIESYQPRMRIIRAH